MSQQSARIREPQNMHNLEHCENGRPDGRAGKNSDGGVQIILSLENIELHSTAAHL
jgi:hypothetical protein